jgi:peptidoglycan hydrolase-like protein with peptidoglycan-binding domain
VISSDVRFRRGSRARESPRGPESRCAGLLPSARMTHRTARHRLASALVGLIVLVGTSAPALAAVSTFYRTQSLGDRGTDVATIQQLIHHHQTTAPPPPGGRTVIVRGIDPLLVPIDGIYGATTAEAVRAFQASRGLAESGIVDGATWSQLVIPVGPGATGDAVVAVQRLLHEKRAAAVPTYGVYDLATTAAVKTFQAHIGLAQTGSVDGATWRALVWHFELPRFSSAALCDYSSGNGPANWGTAETISTLEAAGAAMVAAGYGRVGIGDVSWEHGGNIPDHQTHELGLDADIRPMRKANDQCSYGTRWTLASYDRAATRALVKAIRAATPGHVKLIFFNDPVLIGDGLTTKYPGHDDHLHLRLCEVGFSDSRYRC